MEIGPVANKQPLDRPDNERETAPTDAPAPKPDPDQAIISSEARAWWADQADRRLRAELAGTGPVKATDEKRLDTIRSRIESGFYDRPEVKAKIADNLINGLELQTDQE